MSFHEALVAVLATWGVWRLGGNTIAWCKAVGKICRWDDEAKARVQALWYKACYTKDLGTKLFYCRLRPAKDLWRNCGKAKFHQIASQIAQQIAMLEDCVARTLAQTRLRELKLERLLQNVCWIAIFWTRRIQRLHVQWRIPRPRASRTRFLVQGGCIGFAYAHWYFPVWVQTRRQEHVHTSGMGGGGRNRESNGRRKLD